MTQYDYLIVGAGLYGCVFARQMTDAGKKCLVIDKRGHIGGTIHCDDVEGVPRWDFTNDFADWQHLNVQGSVKLSHQLGKDLLALYDLPDRRGQPGYESYDACADLWFGQYPKFLPLEKGRE